MKRLCRYFSLLFFSVLLILTAMAAVGLEEYDSNIINSTEDYVLLQNRYGGITITAYRGTERIIEIPQSINGIPVTIIGTKAFYSKDLAEVIIPESVLIIEPMAFADNQLESVTIPGSSYIGYEAFANNQLDTVNLSAQLASIGPRAFFNNNLSAISIPQRVTSIGRDAFAGNPISIITVGANRNLFSSQGFEISFVNYYISQDRIAGVYIKTGRIWVLQENE